MSQTLETVYIVDSDEFIKDGIQTLLSSLDIPVMTFGSAEEFLNSVYAQGLRQGCILFDANLKGMGSNAFLKKLKQDYPDLPIVVMNSSGKQHIIDRMMIAGAQDVIEKPFVNEVLLRSLRKVLKTSPALWTATSSVFRLSNGFDITIRSIRLKDLKIDMHFLSRLSSNAKYRRFLSGIKKLTPYMLGDLSSINYPHHWVLIATADVDGKEIEIGVADYAKVPNSNHAEFALVVDEGWRHLGVASYLFRELVEVARAAGVEQLVGLLTQKDEKLVQYLKGLGFHVENDPLNGELVRSVLDLRESKIVNSLINDKGIMSD